MLEAVGRVSEEKGSKAFCSYHQSQILRDKRNQPGEVGDGS